MVFNLGFSWRRERDSHLFPKLALWRSVSLTLAQRDKNNEWQKPLVIFMAEREGFEPSCACAQTDFESAPL